MFACCGGAVGATKIMSRSVVSNAGGKCFVKLCKGQTTHILYITKARVVNTIYLWCLWIFLPDIS